MENLKEPYFSVCVSSFECGRGKKEKRKGKRKGKKGKKGRKVETEKCFSVSEGHVILC